MPCFDEVDRDADPTGSPRSRNWARVAKAACFDKQQLGHVHQFAFRETIGVVVEAGLQFFEGGEAQGLDTLGGDRLSDWLVAEVVLNKLTESCLLAQAADRDGGPAADRGALFVGDDDALFLAAGDEAGEHVVLVPPELDRQFRAAPEYDNSASVRLMSRRRPERSTWNSKNRSLDATAVMG